MFSWFFASFNRVNLYRKREIRSLILVGIGYSSHVVSKEILSSRQYKVAALIDEEPWNHKTVINGCMVHYPVEIEAIVARYNVKAVVIFDEETKLIDEQLLAALQLNGISVIKVPQTVQASEKLNFIHSYFLK